MSDQHQAPSLDGSTYTLHAPLHHHPLGLPPSVPLPTTYTVHSEVIYHGLPDWSSPEYKAKTAIVAGANGISGAYMLRVMADNPEIWETVYSISRKPPQVGKALRELGVQHIDYAFFYAFIPTQASNKRTLFKEAEELANINGKLLDNLLEGISAAGLHPKRVLLQTGCKGYGQHYGPIITPVVEDDRCRARVFHEANFYCSQEDVLWKFSKKHNVEYRQSWDKQILAPQAADHVFHTADGSLFSWHRFWPWLGKTFGLKTAPPAADDDRNTNWQSYEMYRDAAIDSPHRAVCKYTSLLADWVQTEEVCAAWKDMADKYKLDTTLMKQDYIHPGIMRSSGQCIDLPSVADFAITIWWNLQLKSCPDPLSRVRADNQT
ncbi:hypothetical protein CALVIDRAFT_602250 [Calocera viscosa TUFC12733]|uniref:NAD-dependent epimerase/dehydratase domain-containing protein n=1 Tax=Calocera viscosa (strain TUFC12733) TaxID=1330018 RepID=A0A167HB24_CALVF|nr:hypothetical protein CALVIDRAFT_602250 [Calocera viscosa TUFC12733]